MHIWLRTISIYLPHAIIAIIVVLTAWLGYQQYATSRAIDRARQIGDMAVLGTPQGDVTVVAFFDYNCPPCATVGKTLTKVMKDRRDVRVIVRPLPVLGEKSEKLAKFAIAATLQGQFQAYHMAFLDEMTRRAKGSDGELAMGRSDALRVARKAGLDTGKLQKTAKSERVAAILARNVGMAEQLDIAATPTYLIGPRLYTPFYGAPESEDFHRMLDAVQPAS